MPLTKVGCGQPGRLEDGRRDVDDVVELVADLALGLDPVRPADDRAVAGAAPVRGDLLGPLVGRVHRVGPADRVVVVGLGRPELVDAATAMNSVVSRPPAPLRTISSLKRAVRRALGRRAVVADDHVDQRVVEDARGPRARR